MVLRRNFSGIRYSPYKPYYSRSAAAETFLIEEFCANVKADLFISTFYTTPLETPALFPAHDLVPELADSFDPTWLREKRYCTYHAASYLAASNNTLRDLHEVFYGAFFESPNFQGCSKWCRKHISSCGRGRCRCFQEKWEVSSPIFF